MRTGWVFYLGILYCFLLVLYYRIISWYEIFVHLSRHAHDKLQRKANPFHHSHVPINVVYKYELDKQINKFGQNGAVVNFSVLYIFFINSFNIFLELANLDHVEVEVLYLSWIMKSISVDSFNLLSSFSTVLPTVRNTFCFCISISLLTSCSY